MTSTRSLTHRNLAERSQQREAAERDATCALAGERRTPRLTRVVLTWLATAPGGAEKTIPALAALIARVPGLSVDVLWWSWDGSRAPDAGHARVREVNNIKAYEIALLDLLRQDVPGSVLVSNHRTSAIDIAAAATVGLPVACVLRAMFLPAGRLRYVDPSTGSLLGLLPTELDWQLLGRADVWVGISQTAADSIRLVAPPHTRVETIYNGVSAPSPTSARPRAPRRFVAVCRSEPWKELDVVVDGFARAARRHPEITLDVVGGGPLLGTIESRVNSLGMNQRIRLHGHRDDVWSWLERSDVMLHGARAEGFGRAVAEASIAGRPAIVPNGGATPELIVDGTTGMTFVPGDSEALASRIHEIVAWSAERWLDASVAASTFATPLFTETRMASEYLKLCNRLCRSQGTST